MTRVHESGGVECRVDIGSSEAMVVSVPSDLALCFEFRRSFDDRGKSLWLECKRWFGKNGWKVGPLCSQTEKRAES